VAFRREPITVYEGRVLREVENTRPRIAWLRFGGYTTNLDPAEPEIKKSVNRFPLLVKPSGQPNWIRDLVPPNLTIQYFIIYLRVPWSQTTPEDFYRKFMARFRIKGIA